MLSPPSKRNAATRLQSEVPFLVQEERLYRDFAPVDFNPIVSIFGNLSLQPGLLRLPKELLDNIASFLIPTTTVHIMEGIGMSYYETDKLARFYPAHNPVSKQYKLELSDLRHLALVCRRFNRVVEGQLYRDISLPLREPQLLRGRVQDSSNSVLCLARTLFNRPDLAACVISLRLWLQDRRISPVCGLVKELNESQELALHAIIISLLPRLESVEIYGPVCCPKIWTSPACPDSRRAVSWLSTVLREHPTLTSIHLDACFRVPNLPTSNLTTLTLDILCFGDRLDLLNEPQALPSVHTLRVTLNLAILKWQDFNRSYPSLHPRDGLRIFLRDVVLNLSKFEIQSPKGIIPYLNGVFDRRGNKLSALRLEDAQDIEFNPLHVRGHDSGAFNWLLIVLLPVKDRLLQLSLPSNWYSSAGKHVKAIPSLKRLTRLVALQLPHVAVVSNPHGKDFDPALHHTPATQFLPTSLEILTLTQVDMDTCSWLEEALVEHHLLPRLRCVYLYLREDYWACVPQGFGDVVRNSGVRVVVYWREHAKVL